MAASRPNFALTHAKSSRNPLRTSSLEVTLHEFNALADLETAKVKQTI
jgi:hypothetical protein